VDRVELSAVSNGPPGDVESAEQSQDAVEAVAGFAGQGDVFVCESLLLYEVDERSEWW